MVKRHRLIAQQDQSTRLLNAKSVVRIYLSLPNFDFFLKIIYNIYRKLRKEFYGGRVKRFKHLAHNQETLGSTPISATNFEDNK